MRKRHVLSGLAVALASLGCRSGLEPDWDSIRAEIEKRYPNVPATSVDELHARLQETDAVPPILLDARTAEEFAVSHIEGALRLTDEADWLALLGDPSTNPEIVCYCSVGWRSAGVVERLQQAGYTNARNLDGSLFAWANAGYPMVRDGGERVTVVHGFDDEWETLLEPEHRAPR